MAETSDSTSIHYSIRISKELEAELKAAREECEKRASFPPSRNQFLRAVIREGLRHYKPVSRAA